MDRRESDDGDKLMWRPVEITVPLPRRRSWLLVLIGPVAAATIVAVMGMTSPASADAADQQAIASVLRRAVVELQVAYVPPPDKQNAPLDVATRHQMEDSLPAQVYSLFTGRQADNVYHAQVRAIELQGSGTTRVRGGGVDWFKVDKITISGDGAWIDATAEGWAAFAQDQGNGHFAAATPHNIEIYHCHLVKVGGTWKIDIFNSRFAPGSEP